MAVAVDKPDLIAFGQRVRQFRTAANLSQAALADLVGINRVNLSRIETGLVDVSFSTLVALASALNVGVADLAPPADPEPPKPMGKRK